MRIKSISDPTKNINFNQNQKASILSLENFRLSDLSTCFKVFLNDMAIGIFVLKRGLLIHANTTFLRSLGYEDESELRGKPFTEFFCREDRKRFELDDWVHHESQIDKEKMLRICTKNGLITWANIGIKRFVWKTEGLHLGYLVDLTKIKKDYDRIAASLKRSRVIFKNTKDVSAPVDSGGNIRFHNIIGHSDKMRAIYNLVENLADMDTTVLVLGESGTGKELVARAIHYSGARAHKPFVAVNCSALSESLLESELFGHVKGSFTGAIKSREGRFQLANGGTILLDEIGDISPLIQVKLLRVIQEKTVERVGESNGRKVDVRIIACTNKDLKAKVKLGKFREDLYYRLKVVEIDLPPLREREGDIALLVNHFHKIFNKRFNKQVEAIDHQVLKVFMNYSWPGNVRELEHVLEHAFVLCQHAVITLNDLPVEFQDHVRVKRLSLPQPSKKVLAEADVIKDALIRSKGNKAKAARLLGISRPTIYRKIYQYQISSNW